MVQAKYKEEIIVKTIQQQKPRILIDILDQNYVRF
jgi:hypothetical protein